MFWEKFNRHSRLVTLIIALLIAGLFFAVSQKKSTESSNPIGYSLETTTARVTSIVEQGDIQLGEVSQKYQIVNIMVLKGEYSGEFFSLDYGKRSILPTGRLLTKGEKILVLISGLPDGSISASFVDYVRLDSILILIGFFVVLCVLITRWKGVRSLLGTSLSILIILFFIIPQIYAGKDPIFISILGSFVFIALSLYLVYGWTLKTHLSIFSLLISLLITGFLAAFFVFFTGLDGTGDESAIYLLQTFDQTKIVDLLIAGIIIGALGVMDDLIVSQISVVIEIFRSNPDASFKQRFASAMNVGRDHIAATINTLVLAYLGASLPLFMLISNANTGASTLINMSILAEEIVRTLVGTTGLVLAVPISTFLACWAVDKPERHDKLITVFGPLLGPSEIEHPHHH